MVPGGISVTIDNNSVPIVFKAGNNFKVSTAGKIYATEADISGHIEADTGKIGHWEIDNEGHLKSSGITLNALESEIKS